MSKKFNIPNFDTKKLMDGAKLLADNGKIFLEKHGSKLAVVGLVGASIDNLKTRHKLKKTIKEKEENEVKTQQAVCKLQAVVEAVSEEYEEVLCMNEKLQEALENTMEVHKDEKE